MIFSSVDKFHKSVIGAVAEGTTLRLRLCLPSDCVSAAFINLTYNGQTKKLPLYLDGVYWQIDLPFYSPGIYLYNFEYYNNGSAFLYQLYMGDNFEAVPCAYGPKWQQTVYSADYTTPDAFKKGVVYQIFPDRFYNSGTKKDNPFTDRYIADWNDPVAFSQDGSSKRQLNNDYYCGDLKGIEQKLDYIKSLGASVIYINPIFEAHSNHRYNTADYKKIDPLLGDENDFTSLCNAAHKMGIKIVLDGVFSHTGSDSIYFNLEGRYEGGAYNDEASPYRDWYTFGTNKFYHSWWGIKTLPEVNEMSSFCEYICGDNGILEYWLERGADGFRLDVADELPDEFIKRLRKKIKSINPNALLLGEVWEDASNKESYNTRRQFLYGKELDSVTNYVFKNAVIDFCLYGDAHTFKHRIAQVVQNYPKCSLDCAFNLLGTHDTERILTRLGGVSCDGRSREWQSKMTLSTEQYKKGVSLLKIAAVLNYTLPGMPLLYYGDEVGVEGYSDPFNRAPYPWGKEDNQLLQHFQKLGELRYLASPLDSGRYKELYFNKGCAVFAREDKTHVLVVAVNAGNDRQELQLAALKLNPKHLYGAEAKNGKLTLDAKDFSIHLIKKVNRRKS
ncbi:MAG: glycoside hydrolase family 13 protein [Clostridia bacterium]|nr:glycoside hydrolase family 13 protein [Clostridia bacterium]